MRYRGKADSELKKEGKLSGRWHGKFCVRGGEHAKSGSRLGAFVYRLKNLKKKGGNTMGKKNPRRVRQTNKVLKKLVHGGGKISLRGYGKKPERKPRGSRRETEAAQRRGEKK